MGEGVRTRGEDDVGVVVGRWSDTGRVAGWRGSELGAM